jgi:cation diffusion facilitator CzcD-associated flavoprotein CzcO
MRKSLPAYEQKWLFLEKGDWGGVWIYNRFRGMGR